LGGGRGWANWANASFRSHLQSINPKSAHRVARSTTTRIHRPLTESACSQFIRENRALERTASVPPSRQESSNPRNAWLRRRLHPAYLHGDGDSVREIHTSIKPLLLGASIAAWAQSKPGTSCAAFCLEQPKSLLQSSAATDSCLHQSPFVQAYKELYLECWVYACRMDYEVNRLLVLHV
jgi:hypothetical protein